jgi:diguanylate cyclase
MICATLDELDFEYATAVADQSLRTMSREAVPPTPNNFEVWFNYSTGALPDLKRTIDILVGNKRRFDAAVNRDLFDTYIRSQAADHAAHDISGQLQTVLSTAREFLTTAITDNRSQIHALDGVASQVENNGDPRSIIASLVTELSKAAVRAVALEKHLTKTSKEMDQIRDSLKKSEERAKTDMLTGLANRRALNEFLRTTQIAAMEHGRPLSILLLDIDHFKKFNDNFGHQVGDQVLRLTADILRKSVREVDLAARYGGEELMAVFPNTELRTCEEIAESIRRSIADCRITRRSTGQVISSITVSIGVAQFQFGESIDQLIERCDRALYLAKQTGRNRTVTENELDHGSATARRVGSAA